MFTPKPILHLNASDGEENDQFFDAPLNVLMEIPRCPKGMEWHYRPLSLCGDKMKYTCLNISYPDMNMMKGETCGGPRVEISGSKAVLNNYYFDNKICSSERYQPINFNSIGRSHCELLKSLCSEIGSIVSKVGSSSVDTSCRCDNIESFAPVGSYYDIHNCKPFEDDCSCYLVECLPGQKLSAEYKCTMEDLLTAAGSAQGVTGTTYTNPFETLITVPFMGNNASDDNDEGALGWVPKILIITAVGGVLSYGVYLVIKKCRQQLTLKDVDAEDGFNQTE